jgi:anaerobic selenocysteine-containing dehydrogenase
MVLSSAREDRRARSPGQPGRPGAPGRADAAAVGFLDPEAPWTDPGAGARIVHRTCNLCEAHCGVSVEVEGGGVRTIRGDAEDALSRGYLCPKAYGLKGLQEDPDRVREPRIREGGRFREASWDEALELAARRLRALRDAHGADAIATYLGNPNAHDFGSGLALPTFQRALGTRWRFSASSVDQLPKMMSSCLVFGAPLANPIPDIDHTDFLLALGANPLASNGSLMTAPDFPGRLRRLRERGGRLVVVDPRRSETAEVADEHVSCAPDGRHLLFAMCTCFRRGPRAPRRPRIYAGVERWPSSPATSPER